MLLVWGTGKTSRWKLNLLLRRAFWKIHGVIHKFDLVTLVIQFFLFFFYFWLFVWFGFMANYLQIIYDMAHSLIMQYHNAIIVLD